MDLVKLDSFDMDEQQCHEEGCGALVALSIAFACSNGKGLAQFACVRHAPEMLARAFSVAIDPNCSEPVQEDPRQCN